MATCQSHWVKNYTKLASEKKIEDIFRFLIGKTLWKLFSYPPQENSPVKHRICFGARSMRVS